MRRDISASGPRNSIKRFSARKPAFVCVISYTATCEIPGLTIAGANPDLVKYTSTADAEFLYHGKCLCIDGVPATPDGKPTPAIISRTALSMGEIPVLVVDAGAKVKPSIPAISFEVTPGSNIATGNAMRPEHVQKAFEYGNILGKQLARSSDLVTIGESIPGGTTTALAVLSALGVSAKFRVSSSMPENPHALKNRVVESAMKRSDVKAGIEKSPFDAIAKLGDPMMPSVAGIASGALEGGSRVMLAGGTQMAAVILLLKQLGVSLHRICIGTTSYLIQDKTSDLVGMVEEIAKSVPVLSCDLHLGESSKPGLRAFAEGFVKEGVGAGGASLSAMLKDEKITGKKLMRAVEHQYEISIESQLVRH